MSERRRAVNPKHGPPPKVVGNVQQPAIDAEINRIAKDKGWTVEDVRQTWSERAAIREYVGGATRSVAEVLALADLLDTFGYLARRAE